MTPKLHLASLLLLSALSYGAGATIPDMLPVQTDVPVDASILVPASSPDAWRAALRDARGTAEAGTWRAHALEVLNTAEGDEALMEGIELLGWVAIEDDEALLDSIVRSGEPLRGPALEALGRLGTDGAVDILLSVADGADRDARRRAIRALGASGHDLARPRLEQALLDPQESAAGAAALAQLGGAEVAGQLQQRLHQAPASDVLPVAQALAGMEDPAARVALHNALRFGAGPARGAAMQALARVGDPALFEVLAQTLGQGSQPSRIEAAMALGQLRDPRGVPLLSETATSSAYDLSSACLAALVDMGLPSSHEALLDIIEGGPTDAASLAIQTIRRVDEPDTVSVLIGAATERPTQVRETAALRLFTYPWPRGRVPEALLELARDQVAGGASRAGSGEALSFLLVHGSADDRAGVEAVLLSGPAYARAELVWRLQGDLSARATALLFTLLDDPSPEVRNSAMQALVGRGGEVEVRLEDRLLERLEAGTSRDFGAVEQVLVQLGSERAVALLVDRVENGTEREWGTAIAALSNSGPENAEKLAKILDRTEDERLRRQLFSALLYSPSADSASVVARALNEDHPEIRAEAAYALGRAGTAEGRTQLLGMVDESDPQVRTAALSALATLGGPDVEARLIGSLDDPELSFTALTALQSVGSETAREAITAVAAHNADPQLRSSALYHLAHSPGPGSEAVLEDALRDGDASVQSAAISALQTLGTSNAAASIAALLGGDDAAALQAAWAVRALGGRVAEQHRERIEALIGQDEGWGDHDCGFEGEIEPMDLGYEGEELGR